MRQGRPHCRSVAASGDHVPLSLCYGSRKAYPSLSLPTTFYKTTTTHHINVIHLIAPMVEIVWQESDRPSSTTATTTSTKKHTTTTIPKPPASHQDLSKSAKIAIGVIVPVVVIAAFVAALYFFRRWRGQQPAEQHNLTELDVSYVDNDNGGSVANRIFGAAHDHSSHGENSDSDPQASRIRREAHREFAR
jgi:hypothetical protein